MEQGFTTNHERFGELSALALVGQVSHAEYQELQRHLESCAACREEYFDFARILSTELPLLAQNIGVVESDRGTGRFAGASLELPETFSANHENIAGPPFASETHRVSDGEKFWPLLGHVPRLAAAVSFGLIIAVVILSFGIHRHVINERSLAEALAASKSEVAQLRDRIRSNQPLVAPVAPPQPDAGIKKIDDSELAMRASLAARLKASKTELRLLQNELEGARSEEKEISSRASEVQERLEKTARELEAMAQERNQATATLENKQQELAALDLELKEARDTVDRDRRLLAADRDIRDLMGARNVRMVDVFDVDGEGRTQRPFGRVFFTEGKSLVFYAFDLDRAPTSLRAAAFQGWGAHGLHPVQSLGIFYHDDKTTNRWFLTFDDPQVLAEIDSVFVTIEPPGGSKRPTGRRLLPAAYLKADLNHP